MAQPVAGTGGKEDEMTTKTLTRGRDLSVALPVLMAALLGLGIVVITGHVQAAALHDAAHDVRHATGFPCH